MKNYSLHEISKVLSGVVLADILTMAWLSSQKLLPAHFLGVRMGQDMLLPSIIFELALFIIFVHYGWNIGKIPRLREAPYLLVVGSLFSVIAIAHIWQLLTNTDLMIMGIEIPSWLSWIGVALSAYLAYISFVLMARSKR